jgi:hypothetical protein
VIVLTFVLSATTNLDYYDSYLKFQFSMAIISIIFCGVYFIVGLVKADIGAKIAPVIALLLAILYDRSSGIVNDCSPPEGPCSIELQPFALDRATTVRPLGFSPGGSRPRSAARSTPLD